MNDLLFWNKQQLQEVKQTCNYNDILDSCLNRADSYTREKIRSVTDKDKSFCSDKHNYESLSIYYWADSTDNEKGKYKAHDGMINPEYKLYDYPKLWELSEKLKYLSLAYYFSNKEKYYKVYIKIIRTWFIDPNSKMYPNFEYAQVVPGYNNNHGNAHGIIESYLFNDIIESIRLVNSCRKIDKKIHKQLKQWFADFTEWLMTSKNGLIENSTNNNHGIAYDVTLYNMAFFVGDHTTCQNIVNKFRSYRLDKQINSDGSQPNELKRTRAYFYSIFNLTHIIDFCLMLKSNGIYYYQENQKRIDAAIKYLSFFLDNKNLFPYREISNWEINENLLKDEIWRLQRFKAKSKVYYNDGNRNLNISNLLK